MRSITGHLTSLAIAAVCLPLMISASGVARGWAMPAHGPNLTAALAGEEPATDPFVLTASSDEQSAPLTQEQTLKMLQAGVPIRQIEEFARQDGIDFKLTPTLERDLRKAGATEGLIQLLRKLGNSPAAVRSSAPAEAADLSGLLRTAEDALNRKDYAEAVKALKGVIAKQPGRPDVWFNLGYAYTGLHDPAEAVRAYQKTLELAPNLFAARLNLGILLVEQKQPNAALEHLQKAAAMKPENVQAHLYYARALAQTGQPEAAQKEFQEAIRIDPHLAIAQYDLGQLELQQKHPAQAFAAFQQALVLDSTLVQADLGAGLSADALNNPAQAVAHFEKYVAARPDDVKTQFRLAGLYLQQKQNEKARDTLESVYRVKPDLPGLTAALGDANARLKNLPDAEKYYRLAIGAQPGIADLHRALGDVLLKEEKYPQAETEFRTALQLDAHSRDAAIGLASSLDLQKRYAEAIPILELLAKAPDAAPYTFFVLATCYDHLMSRKEALANYQHFLDLSHGENPDQEWQATQRAKLLRRELAK